MRVRMWTQALCAVAGTSIVLCLPSCSESRDATLPNDDGGSQTDDANREASVRDGTIADAPLGEASPGADAADGRFCPVIDAMACPPRFDNAACPEAGAIAVDCPLPAQPVAVRVLLYVNEVGWNPHPAHCIADWSVAQCGRQRGWTASVTKAEADISTANLANFDVVVFMLTGPFGLEDPTSRAALEAFIRSGKGFVAIHSATASDVDPTASNYWPWYHAMLGNIAFAGHPDYTSVQTLRVVDPSSAIVSGLPVPWVRCEEVHKIEPNPASNPDLEIVMKMDEDCSADLGAYAVGEHPAAWRHAYDGGRAFVTSLGHTNQAYQDRSFLRHIAQGIEWAAGR